MAQEVEVGSMIKIPVEAVSSNYKELLNSLTVTNPKYASAKRHGMGFGVSKSIPEFLKFYRLLDSERAILIPRNFPDLPKYLTNFTVADKTNSGAKISQGGDANLRPNQEEFFNNTIIPYIDTVNSNRINRDILINAACGTGKTFMALYLASIYQQRTIIAVTTLEIGKQFIRTVADHFPNWTAGFGKKGDGFDITIETYATLSNKPSTYYKNFGHIILDEYHRCGADTYNAILERAGCQYRTSLTATPRRKDGLYDVLKFHAGKELVMERSEISAKIYPVQTGFEIDEDSFRTVGKFPMRDTTKMMYKDFAVRNRAGADRSILDRGSFHSYNKAMDEVTFLSSLNHNRTTYSIQHNNFHLLSNITFSLVDTEISQFPERDDMVIALISKCLKDDRRILVLSKRKEQLFNLQSRLSRRGIEADLVVSHSDSDYKQYLKKKGVTHAEYTTKVFAESRVILGINKLAEEGMDVPKFDTLIYLHIIKDIEQSIGRILREHDDKKSPIAFSFIDNISMYQNMFYGRQGCANMFQELGHTLEPEIVGMDGIKELEI